MYVIFNTIFSQMTPDLLATYYKEIIFLNKFQVLYLKSSTWWTVLHLLLPFKAD